jgi:hypothetical protein
VYRLDWRLSAGSSKDFRDIAGYALFEPVAIGAETHTRFTYFLATTPDSEFLAKAGAEYSVELAQSAVRALVAHAEKEHGLRSTAHLRRVADFLARF